MVSFQGGIFMSLTQLFQVDNATKQTNMNRIHFKFSQRLFVAKMINLYKALLAIILFVAHSFQITAQTISETAGTMTTIAVTGGEVFADPNDGTNGSVGGDCSTTSSGSPGDYPNCNCVTLTTLTAPAGQQVSVTFSQFRVFGSFDWLAIFDGNAAINANNTSGSANNPTSSDPVLWNSDLDGDELVDMLTAGSVTFNSTNGSLTFASRFSGVVNTCGWEAEVALCEGNACSQPPILPTNAFLTTWEIASNDVITIPLQSGTYNFDYTWQRLSDNMVISGTHTNADGDFTTNFVEAGTYLLSITGQFPHLKDYPVDKLLDVVQWGDILWENMELMFQNWQGAGFLARDAPDLSQATNMRKMFVGASNFNENLDHWDVSNITNMAEVFRDASKFNGNIRNWDVSNVTFFFATFLNAVNFNQDISDWDVSKANSMRDMLENANAFNQPIGKWDVSSVIDFKRMLAAMANFNQPLGDWKFKPNANIDFSQFASGTNNMSCQNYSATILGWNFNNPNLENLLLGGFNADYDAIASIARDELIARGWSMGAGTDIGGDCGTIYAFPCSDSLELGPDTLFGMLTLQTSHHISLNSTVINPIGAIDATSGGDIVLLPGFHAVSGSDFIAKIDNVNCFGIIDTVDLRKSYVSPEELALSQELRANEIGHIEAAIIKNVTPFITQKELTFKVYPNPFRYETKLRFQLPEEEEISLHLFDQMGRLVQTILPRQKRAAGEHLFPLHNDQGLQGFYFVLLQTESKRVMQKVIIANQ